MSQLGSLISSLIGGGTQEREPREGELQIDGKTVAQFDPFQEEGKIVQRGGMLFQFSGGQLVPLEVGGRTVPAPGAQLAQQRRDAQQERARQFEQLNIDRLRARSGLPVSAPSGRASTRATDATGRTTTRTTGKKDGDQPFEGQLLGAFAGLPKFQQEQLMQALGGDPALAGVVARIQQTAARGTARGLQNLFNKTQRIIQNPETTDEQRNQIMDQFTSQVAKQLVKPSAISEAIAKQDAENPSNVVSRLNDKISSGEALTLSDIVYPDPETGKPTVMDDLLGLIPGTSEHTRAQADLMRAQADLQSGGRKVQDQLLRLRLKNLRDSVPILRQSNPHDFDQDPQSRYMQFERQRNEAREMVGRIEEEIILRNAAGQEDVAIPASLQQILSTPPIPVDTQTQAQPFQIKMQNVARDQLPELIQSGRLKPKDRITTVTGAVAEVTADGSVRLVQAP